jgi:hypothetical protein
LNQHYSYAKRALYQLRNVPKFLFSYREVPILIKYPNL